MNQVENKPLAPDVEHRTIVYRWHPEKIKSDAIWWDGGTAKIVATNGVVELQPGDWIVRRDKDGAVFVLDSAGFALYASLFVP